MRRVRSLTRFPGSNADRGTLCERCAPGRRYNRDASLTGPIHRGRDAARGGVDGDEHPRRFSSYGRLPLVSCFCENYDVFFLIKVFFFSTGILILISSCVVFRLIQMTGMFSPLLGWLAAWLVRLDARIGFLIYRPVGTRNFAPATRFITSITWTCFIFEIFLVCRFAQGTDIS